MVLSNTNAVSASTHTNIISIEANLFTTPRISLAKNRAMKIISHSFRTMSIAANFMNMTQSFTTKGTPIL